MLSVCSAVEADAKIGVVPRRMERGVGEVGVVEPDPGVLGILEKLLGARLILKGSRRRPFIRGWSAWMRDG